MNKVTKLDLLSVIVPVYNEEKVISETIRRLIMICQEHKAELDFEIIFIDDGSKDGTFNLLESAAEDDDRIVVLSFSRNFGHQIAVTAGIDYAKGDYIGIIDGDLQDPPELLYEMYKVAKTGYDVVYGKRNTRVGESFFKLQTAKLFYRFFNLLVEIDLPKDTGDFRLITRRVANVLKKMPEKSRFIRGMIPWLGFKSYAFMYDRMGRFAGETKYPLRKMIRFAFNAALSFSTYPLKLATRMGALILVIGILLSLFFLYLKLFTTLPVPGYTSIVLLIIFFSGVQLFFLGIIGEYIGRIFEEVKGRPLYIINQKLN